MSTDTKLNDFIESLITEKIRYESRCKDQEKYIKLLENNKEILEEKIKILELKIISLNNEIVNITYETNKN